MKNIEWLKERLAYYEREVDYGQYGLKTQERYNAVGKVDAINEMKEFVEEMDEPEKVVTKQDDAIWFEEMAKELGVKFTVKEVVPFWFDDWYEEIKRFYPDKKIQKAVAIKIINQAGNGHHFENQFGEKIENDSVDVFYEIYNNREKYTRAILDGYSIEKPKLLTVIVKDYDKTIMNKQLPEDEVEKMMKGKYL